MALRKSNPQFSVTDVVKTANYYRDILGFTIQGFFGDPPVFAIVWRDHVQIHFNQLPEGASTKRVRAPVAYDAYFHVTEVNSLAEEFRNRGAEILEGPVDRVYGQREVVVRDINDLILAFGEGI